MTGAKTVRWGIQKFLNEAVSWDGGSIKLVVAKKLRTRPTFSCKVRDCEEQIELDFDPVGGLTYPYRGNLVSKTQLKNVRASYRDLITSTNARRKKARLLAHLFTTFADKVDQAMDLYVEEEKLKLDAYEYYARTGKVVTTRSGDILDDFGTM